MTVAETPRQGRLVSPRECGDVRELSEMRFVSINRHGERRRREDLVAINAGLWADLDIREGSPLASLSPETLCDLLLDRLSDARMTPPSYVLFSGRGLWAVWLLDPPLPA